MKSVAIVLLLAIPSWCAAAVNCETASSTPDLNECAAEALAKAETQLNATYREVLSHLAAFAQDDPDSREAREKLIVAQRLWVKFREADCDAVYTQYKGGTIRTLMHLGCMTDHAEKRIKDLQSFLN